MTNSDTTTTTYRPTTDPVALSLALDRLMDCQWAGMDLDDIAELPNAAIASAVERHYFGGWAGFCDDIAGAS